jgi:hypothetical protein
MSRTDHSRRAKRPEHGDAAPRFQHRPIPRRAKTRLQALIAAIKEF